MLGPFSVMTDSFEFPISVAPMMQCTDRYFRYFMRQITRRTLLYTEMVTARGVLNGDLERLLGFDDLEHPIALQLGGDDPTAMAEAARIGRDFGYDEININVGCPSDRVQSGNFGACLMDDPDTVARCVEAMQRAVDVPVTVKHRIGVDERDRYEDMHRFVSTVSSAGCTRFTVHARKAWLQGLSPKENRTVPPLRYEDVYRLKHEFPTLTIEINGGIQTLQETREHLGYVDAVMIGRQAYDTPWLFAQIDPIFFGEPAPTRSRHEAVEAVYDYLDRKVATGVKLSHMTRHLLNLFKGCPGARSWRRHLSENAHLEGADSQVVRDALEYVPRMVDTARSSAS